MNLAINMTFVGMTVVFMALIVLALVISLFSIFFRTNKEQKTNTPNSNVNEASILEVEKDNQINTASESEDNISQGELLAVITAAVNACLGHRTNNKLVVKSFTRVSQSAPVWNTTGRSEYISGKL
ncbi:MAG: OadG family protein [Clostridia bacterium]|nr:OadG family protein [Clostridia bacterium]